MAEKKHGLNKPPDPRDESRLQGGPGKQGQDWPGETGKMRPRPDHGEASYAGTGRLRGRVALVTGADSGIGRAVAIAFAREGADVAVAYLDEHGDAEETLRWIQEAGRRGMKIAADLTDRENCRAVVERTVAEFGRLDILVNNAGFQMEQKHIADITPEQLEHTFKTNIYATFYVTQAALEHLKVGGVIINTGSVTALEGNPGLLDYSATKGAIHAFTRSLSVALAERGIRVNCVAPGPVWTPLIPSTFSEEKVETFGANTRWGRAAQPSEIAPSYVFLASDDGRYYTGEILAPTGRGATR